MNHTSERNAEVRIAALKKFDWAKINTVVSAFLGYQTDLGVHVIEETSEYSGLKRTYEECSDPRNLVKLGRQGFGIMVVCFRKVQLKLWNVYLPEDRSVAGGILDFRFYHESKQGGSNWQDAITVMVDENGLITIGQ